MFTSDKVKNIVDINETKQFSVFNTHTKYITQEFVGNAKDVIKLYGNEYVITCDEDEHNVDIFI